MQLTGNGRTAEIYKFEETKVLKLFYEWIQYSEVEMEYKISDKIQKTSLPVPAVYKIERVNGRYGIVYEKIKGESMMYKMFSNIDNISEYIKIFAYLHSDIHRYKIKEIPSQIDYLRICIETSDVLTNSERDNLLSKLKKMPIKNYLCHGDYHPDNIIITENNPVIIDWLTATSGDHVADIARTILLISISNPIDNEESLGIDEDSRKLLCKEYLNAYKERAQFEDESLYQWIPFVAGARLNENIPQNEKTELYKLARGKKFEL